jgi:uncharacterized membrane protein YhhN
MTSVNLAIAVAATAGCAAVLAGLLVAERRDRADLRRKAKPLASAAFLVVAIACAPTRAYGLIGFAGPSRWIALGLVLGAVGDILLMYPGDRAFLGGLVAFLGGHVAYVVAFAGEVPVRLWPDAPLSLIIPPIVAAAIALAWLWRHLGKMRVPVIAYVVVITAMVIGALVCAWGAHAPPLRPQVAAAGALLFFASDLSVARDRFVREGFVNRAWGLPAYYAGQLLFAWSIAP